MAPLEEVLDLSEEASDPSYPTVCFDEKLMTLHADVRAPQPPAPGQVERIDDAYERLGTANLFFLVEPLAGWRHVEMTERRTKLDDAEQIRWLVDHVSPKAESIRIVQDTLHTPLPAALSEAFPPAEARRILPRVAFHSTPKHGRWLHLADIEISMFQRGCLSRRMDCLATLRRRINTRERKRHRERAPISWQFPTHDAREKLHNQGLGPR